ASTSAAWRAGPITAAPSLPASACWTSARWAGCGDSTHSPLSSAGRHRYDERGSSNQPRRPPMLPRSWLASLAVLTLLALAVPVRADKLTRAEIGKRGKAATAFVDIPGRVSGTAFCVHPSGLFLTNEHVVRGTDRAEIKLVLDAGLKTQ